jgi:hypothetical protein
MIATTFVMVQLLSRQGHALSTGKSPMTDGDGGGPALARARNS